MNERRFALASGLALVLSLSFVPRARADQAPISPLARVATVSNTSVPRLEVPTFVRLTAAHAFGLVGANLRLQLARPLAPYVEGRMADGVAASRPDGALMIPGTPIGLSGAVGAGWMYTRGVDLGVDVQRFRAGYVSIALGWLRSTWPVGGFDRNDRLVATDVSRDGVVFKVGLSF